MKILLRVKGSAYSGNYDHAGIPGHQGGSAPNFRRFSTATEGNIYALENLSPKTPLTGMRRMHFINI